MVLGVWFRKLPRAAELRWESAFPKTILAWDIFLERDDRSRQEGCISWSRTPDFTGAPPSMASGLSMWEELRWLSLVSNGWVED